MPPSHLQYWDTHHGAVSEYPYLWHHNETKQWIAVNKRGMYTGKSDGYVVEAWNAPATIYEEKGWYGNKKRARKRAVELVRETPDGIVYKFIGHAKVLTTMDFQDFQISDGLTLRMQVPTPPDEADIDSSNSQFPI